jgi:hypothetical protein
VHRASNLANYMCSLAINPGIPPEALRGQYSPEKG